MNAGEAREMLDAARMAKRLHMIDHELRFNPTRARIAEMIHGGDLGVIRHVNISTIGASWANPASRPMGDWWSDAALGGGRLGANGSHQVDMLRWWMGEPTSVIGQALTVVPDRMCKNTGEPWTATSDDLSHFTLEMQSGALAQVFMSGVAVANMGNETQVFGTKGTITLSNSDEKLYFAKSGTCRFWQRCKKWLEPSLRIGLCSKALRLWTGCATRWYLTQFSPPPAAANGKTSKWRARFDA
jgi:predicted dehydrogenase